MDLLWKVFKSCQLKFVSEIPRELTCAICHNVLMNAVCAPCGCRFCTRCMVKYLHGEYKICPTEKLQCKQVPLSKENIKKDKVANEEICKLNVICPNTNCGYKCPFQTIPEHMKNCCKSPARCVFQDVGCDEMNLTTETLNGHLQSKMVDHTKLLIKFIKSTKEEILMKVNDVDYKLAEAKISIDKKIQAECASLLAEVEQKLKTMQFRIPENDATSSEKAEERKDTSKSDIGKITDNLEKIRKKTTNEIIVLNNKLDENINSQKILEEKLTSLASLVSLSAETHVPKKAIMEETPVMNGNSQAEISTNQRMYSLEILMEKHVKDMKTELQSIRRQLDEIRSVKLVRNESIGNDSEMSFGASLKKNKKVQVKHGDIFDIELPQLKADTDFLWKVDSIDQKLQSRQHYFSDNFISPTGYKMRLKLWFLRWTDGYYLYLYFQLLKGDLDSKLQWPMRNEISLSLIDQDLRLPHFTVKLRHEWSQLKKAYEMPISDESECLDGICKGIEFHELRQIIKNNSLIVLCRVTG